MCDPVSLSIAAIAVATIATGVSAYGAYQETKAQNAAAEYNARIHENNAKISEYQAQDALQRGKIEEKQFRLRLSQEQGSRRAGYAASGVVVDDGSSLDLLLDAAEYGEQDAITIRHNAEREAFDHRAAGSNSAGAAALSRLNKRSPGFAAGTTLLNGTSNILSSASAASSARAGATKAGS